MSDNNNWIEYVELVDNTKPEIIRDRLKLVEERLNRLAQKSYGSPMGDFAADLLDDLKQVGE